MHLDAEGIRKLAATPRPYDMPAHPVGDPIPEMERDWLQAAATVADTERARQEQRAKATAAGGPDRLNRLTLDFIRTGAGTGDRHRLLYSAASNLGEFGCPSRLASALLMPSAIDSGLAPGDAARQIACGLQKGMTSHGEGD
jgi:hypothetical protein